MKNSAERPSHEPTSMTRALAPRYGLISSAMRGRRVEVQSALKVLPSYHEAAKASEKSSTMLAINFSPPCRRHCSNVALWRAARVGSLNARELQSPLYLHMAPAI